MIIDNLHSCYDQFLLFCIVFLSKIGPTHTILSPHPQRRKREEIKKSWIHHFSNSKEESRFLSQKNREVTTINTSACPDNTKRMIQNAKESKHAHKSSSTLLLCNKSPFNPLPQSYAQQQKKGMNRKEKKGYIEKYTW